MSIHVGIDLGSASLKVALFSSDPEDAGLLDRLASEEGLEPLLTLWGADRKPSWLAVMRPTRIAGAPATHARLVLERVVGAVEWSARGVVACTGSGAAVLQREFGIEQVDEFRALTRAVDVLLPTVHTLFEMGGETSRYLRFERRPGRELAISDYQSNGDCAAGTGAFLEQQAARLQFRTEEIGAIAIASRRSAQIAGRCSVFAKSDMVHAQQKGFTPEEVVSGLCDAVARNFRSSITRGRPIVRDVALIGGVAANAGVVRALERAFAWEPGTLQVPRSHRSFGAMGAALLGHEHARMGAGRSPDVILVNTGPPRAFPVAPPLSMRNVLVLRDRLRAVRVDGLREQVDAFLGIDIGSVSTNLVVIDAHGEVLEEIYLRTNARPIEAVATGLRQIQEELAARIRIRGVGTTGSGRELIGELVGADVVKDEITAHKTGSSFVDERLLGLGVDTIFEIGGQDAKFISIQNGVVVDFAMNEACAAGTGSFLEERARELGIRIEGEFASVALASDTPVRLGERCTVFMERDVNDYLRRGAAVRDVIAGLAYSVATNYVNRVVQRRRIGDVVFFQGGTAYNDAIAAALSGIVRKRIIVPPFNGVMGALGVALIARERMTARGGESRFRGFVIDAVDYTTHEFTCKGCTNYCEMQRVTVEGEHTYWGDKCSVRYRKAARAERPPVVEDLVRMRQRQLLDGYEPGAGSGPVIGIPLCLSTYDWAPFWFAVFRELGARVLLSEPTTNHIVTHGLESTVSEPCFPIQVAHGHIRWLIENGADLVFVPNNIAAPGDARKRPSFFCPWNQTLPFVAGAAPFIFERRDRLITPTLWFNQGATAVASALRDALGQAGLKWRARRVELAVQHGFEALAAFTSTLAEAGRRAVAALDATGDHGVVLLGRTYNVYDNGVTLDVATKLRQYYGMNVLGFDCLPAEPDVLAAIDERMFWSSGARVLAAAAFVRSRPHLHLIYVTNFKCGPDSYIKHYIEGESGRPFLSLQFDGHNNDAGVLTRCEAYLDSKGALR